VLGAAAGETIAILPEGDADRLGVPPVDFWLFDRATVAVIDYDERGAPRAIIVTDDPLRAAGARQVRDLAVRHAIPLGDYKAGRKAA